MKHRFAALLVPLALIGAAASAAAAGTAPQRLLRRIDPTHVEIVDADDRHVRLASGERHGDWTLMHVGAGESAYAAFEDFVHRDGRLRLIDADGVRLDLGKTAESSEPDARVFLGHSAAELTADPHDVLAAQILAEPGDPEYGEVAAALPPIGNFHSGAHGFLGTPLSFDKVGFAYGGRTPNFDPAVYAPEIDAVRRNNRVLDGLVGGWLPVLRFVYPLDAHDWVEMLAFAPLRLVDGNDRAQPVFYRVARIEDGRVRWCRYVDSYLPFPPRETGDAGAFYDDLLALERGWSTLLDGAMTIDVPDRRVEDMARFSLVRAIMTRVGDWPKYGAYDRDYGGSEHDGFPDTFNVETSAMSDWGLTARAGRYIDNYFGKFVRDDGSLNYRGPETGQFGRMLTVLAQYATQGGDPETLLRWRKRIDAVTRRLLDMRAKARSLPREDPAYGMLSGWSEADSVLDREPARYMQPYLSNSAEAARGLSDLGDVWTAIGNRRSDGELATWGRALREAGDALHADLDVSLARSLLHDGDAEVLPAIAGAREPFHVAVARDPADPQFRSYRAWMEMFHSGMLDDRYLRLIADYRAAHYDMTLGLPGAYGYHTGVVAGFLAYGIGYGLIQHDHVRDALLMLYSDMAHQYTRGSWMAPETRKPLEPSEAAPYATPAQLVVPMMVRWLLAFEDPRSHALWLAKATPRRWLENGARIRVADVPTRWGRVSYTIESSVSRRFVEAAVTLPAATDTVTKLRLRVPAGLRLRAVSIDGRDSSAFDAAAETIDLPIHPQGPVRVRAEY